MLISACTAFTACNDDAEDSPVLASNKLNITVGLQQPQGRAIITGTTLPENSSIGVLLDDGEATSYDAYNNIKFTATTENSKQVWNPASDIVLDETKGTLYAYYPYAAGTNLAAIPVETASQTDYLYAEPVTNVSEKNANVSVTMKHMLANVNVTVNKGTYVGTGNISMISIQSDGIATGGTFNAAQENPAFTTTTGTGTAIEQTISTTLGNATDIMVVPTGAAKPITFMVRVDDVDYTVKSSDVTLESGYSYNYNLSLNSTFLNVDKVSVAEWNHLTKENLTLEKVDEFKNAVVATFNISETEVGTNINVLGKNNFDVQKIKKMEVDGTEVTPTITYTFNIDGEHIVKYLLKDMTTLPDYMFSNCGLLSAITIPKSITSIERAAFYWCKGLTAVIIPNSVTSIGSSAFQYCQGLTALELGNGLKSIEGSAFFNCSSLKAVSIPNTVTKIGDSAFSGCREITTLELGNGLKSIEGSAFSGCSSLKAVTIPNTVTKIGDSAFSGCGGLTSIKVEEGNTAYDSRENCNALIKTATNILLRGSLNTIIPNTVTKIGDNAFSGCTNLTEIAIPNSVTSIGRSTFYNCI